MIIPNTHGDKLQALMQNNKLPDSDKPRVKEAVDKYNIWRNSLLELSGNKDQIMIKSVELLNNYKNFIDIDLIFSSHNDFLYRQKGQLKLDNTVLEEFLPLLVSKVFQNKINDKAISLGPTSCISGIRFDSSLALEIPGGGIVLKQKDQDFAISRRLYLGQAILNHLKTV